MELVTTLRKTSGTAKTFWEAQGNSKEKIASKLTYERLVVEESSTLRHAIINGFRDVLDQVRPKLEAFLLSQIEEDTQSAKSSSLRSVADRLSEMDDVILEKIGELLYSSTIQNEVIIRNAGLPTVPDDAPKTAGKTATVLGNFDVEEVEG